MKALEKFLMRQLAQQNNQLKQVAVLYGVLAEHNPGLPFPEYEFESLKQEIALLNGSHHNSEHETKVKSVYRRYVNLLSARIVLDIDQPADYQILDKMAGDIFNKNNRWPSRLLNEYLELVIEIIFKRKQNFNDRSVSAAIDSYTSVIAGYIRILLSERGVKRHYHNFKALLLQSAKFLLLVAKLNITEDQYLKVSTNILHHFIRFDSHVTEGQFILDQFLRMLYIEQPSFMIKVQKELQSMKLTTENLGTRIAALPQDQSEFDRLAFTDNYVKLCSYTYMVETMDCSEMSLEESKIYLAVLANISLAKHMSYIILPIVFKKPLVLLSQFLLSPHWQELGLYFFEEELKIYAKSHLSYSEILAMLMELAQFLMLNGISKEKIGSLLNVQHLIEQSTTTINEYKQRGGDFINYAHFHQSLVTTLEELRDGDDTQWPLQFAIQAPAVSRKNVVLIPHLKISPEQNMERLNIPDLPLYLYLYCASLNNSDRESFIHSYEEFKNNFLNSDVPEILKSQYKNIIQLMQIMGKDVFKFLGKYIANTTVKSMSDFLDSIFIEDAFVDKLKTLFDKYKNSIDVKRVLEFVSIMELSNKGFTLARANGDNNDVKNKIEKLTDTFNSLVNTTSTLEDFQILYFFKIHNVSLPGDQRVFCKNFIDFKNRFLTIDQQVENREQHGRDFDKFMMKNYRRLEKLFNIMGPDAFVVLARYLVTSALELERLLENLHLDEDLNEPLSELFVKHRASIIDKKNHEPFLSISQILSLDMKFINKDKDWKVIFEALLTLLKTSDDLQQCHDKIAKYSIEYFLTNMGVDPKKIDFKMVLKRIPLNLLGKLVLGKLAMHDLKLGRYLEDIYDQYLISDLTGTSFPYNTNSEIIKKLAQHNQTIRQELKQAGIDTEKAFAYVSEMHFDYGGLVGNVDIHQTIVSLWASSAQLRVRMTEIMNTAISESDIADAKKIIKLLDNFQVPLLKGFKPTHNTPLSGPQTKEIFQKLQIKAEQEKQSVVDKLYDALAKIELNDPKKIEFVGHIQREAGILWSILFDENSNDKKLIKRYKFKIMIWDKKSPDTFNLGTYVGCCLAPDGGHHDALVERRMDDAMFMPVVINEETNKPIALAWMYFARSAESKNDIYLVANFFEIAASYGQDERLRNTIVAHLQEYIGNYAKVIGAKGFLMAHLSYGLIPNFNNFKQMNIQVKKIGGFLDDDYAYYLLSLKESTFHVFSLNRSVNSCFSAQAAVFLKKRSGALVQVKSSISNQNRFRIN